MRRNILYLERNVDGTIGGSYRSLLYLVQLIERTRYEPIVAFYRSHHLMEEFRKTGCAVLILNYPRIVTLIDRKIVDRFLLLRPLSWALLFLQKSLNMVFGSLRLFLANLVLLSKEQIYLVHLNNGMLTAPELLLASKVLGIRTIVHQRGIGTLPRSVRWLQKLVDHVICVSDAARTNLVQQGIPAWKCTTIHNGIAPDELLATIKNSPAEVRRSLGIPSECAIIGIAGMIRAWKGQLVLVKAMLHVRKRHSAARCLIIGGVSDQQDGDEKYREEILAFIRAHNLESQVTLLDYQPRIAEYIQIFDIMVHTAVDPEPFSRAILEGMTLGRVIVGTRTGGTPEAIEDGVSGILVPPNDPVILADRINMLLSDQALRERLGKNASRRIEQRFMIESNVEATQQIYRRILKA